MADYNLSYELEKYLSAMSVGFVHADDSLRVD
jgi:hypothetical protein